MVAEERGVSGAVGDDAKGEFAAQQLTGEGLDARTVTTASVLGAATFPDDGFTGGFFRDGEPLPW